MGKNGYLERQRKLVDIYRQAEKDTYIQYNAGYGNPHFDRSNRNGQRHLWEKNGLKGLCKPGGQIFDTYHFAIEKGPEADYYQNLIDRKLEAVCEQGTF